MAKTVWTDYLTEEAVFRFWYILENNNFKSAIKKAQKSAKMSYSIMHNALYCGLYRAENSYTYGFRVLKQIKEERGLSSSATIANFMGREEILQNIHSMFECATAIRKYAPYGYNSKLFADEFFEIGATETKKSHITKVEPKLLNVSFPNDDELTPNKPNRYRLARNLAKISKELPRILFLTPSDARKKEFDDALFEYKKNKEQFELTLLSCDFVNSVKQQKLSNALDSGFYRTTISNYGFNIAEIIKDNDNRNVITKRELLGHAKKYQLATEMLQANKQLKPASLAEKLKHCGEQSRKTFILKNHTYPECNKGFINTFCEMLAKVYEFDPTLLENTGRSVPEVMEILMKTLSKFQVQYDKATSNEDKKQIEDQINKIKDAFENSNENSI